MSRPKLEVADIFRRHGAAWRAANKAHLSLGQRRVMTAIEVCRTAALGGHVERCEDCAHTRIAYNSCRNRHCPKCQWPAAAAWLAAREAELLPVPYFHIVFTLPAAISAIAYQNKPKVYGLLFTAAAAVLTAITARSHPPRPHTRLHRRPPHLGSDPPASPPCPLHRARRCPIAGWQALDCLKAQLLSSGPRALPPVPAPVPAGSSSHARCRRAAALDRSQHSQGCGRVQSVPRAAAQD